MSQVNALLAYRNHISCISRPLKMESVCCPKSLTRVQVAGGFWGLVLDASFAQQRPTQRLCARAAIYSIVAMSDRRQGRPLAARWGKRAVASAWLLMRPLMRNWDHGRSYSEQWEGCGRASFPRKIRDTIVVGDPLISNDRSGSHPANRVFELSNQAH